MPDIIELAKSSRSTCKVCGEKIQKNEPRFGKESIFRKDNNEYISYKWHHIKCAEIKFPQLLANAMINSELPDETLNLINKLKQKYSNKSGNIRPISMIENIEGKKVNVEGNIIRVSKPKEIIFENKKIISRNIFVEDDDGRHKVVILGTNAELDFKKEDHLVIINGVTVMGSNDRIQVFALESSKVLINPSDTELTQDKSLTVYISDAWERPRDMFASFEEIKSNRAKCIVCGKPIKMQEVEDENGKKSKIKILKLVKPEWAINEETGNYYAIKRSLHLLCYINEEHGEEILKEATSMLTPEIVEKHREELENLYNLLDDGLAKEHLDIMLHS